jgi:glutamate dehydrogenase (NAD(P)+)
MSSDSEPRLRVIWTDPVTGRKGYAVIDRMVNGLAGGGTRMRSGVSMEEVERLARTMSYKNGAFNLPGGGAKGGVDIDPHDPEARGVLSRYVRAMRPLYRNGWGTAEDLGVSQELLSEVFAEQGVGMTVQAMLDRSGDAKAAGARVTKGLAIKVDGIGLADCIGGYGVAEAAAATAEYKGWDLSKLGAVVQGFGSMGGSSARYLAKLGARVVGVVDVNGAVTNPDGLDVEQLLRSRNTLGEIDRSVLRAGDRQVAKERWLEIDADIVVPAAVADAITAENSAKTKARMVVEAANIPTTDEAQRLLHERGIVVIPDYVANGGANAWWWWTLLGVIEADADQSFGHVSTVMRETVRRMLELADKKHITPREAANELSMQNLDRLAERLGEDASEKPLEPVRSA